MKRKTKIILWSVAAALVFLNSFASVEFSRDAHADLSSGEVWISREGRRMAMLTPEGPFPPWSQTVHLAAHGGLSRDGDVMLAVPGNASVRYGALASASVTLNCKRRKAKVHAEPSAQYLYLDLSGTYPLRCTE